MATMARIKRKAEQLEEDLQKTRQALAVTRAGLQSAAGVTTTHDTDGAEKIAARVFILEARAVSIEAAIRANENEAQRHGEILKSKEYKDAQKRIVEIESKLMREADDVFNELTLLLERVQKAVEVQQELNSLVGRYCVDLEPAQQRSKTHNRDFLYLWGVHGLLTARRELESRAGIARGNHRNRKPVAA